MSEQQTLQPIELFYSYAHRDERLRKRLETPLSVLRQQRRRTSAIILMEKRLDEKKICGKLMRAEQNRNVSLFPSRLDTCEKAARRRKQTCVYASDSREGECSTICELHSGNSARMGGIGQLSQSEYASEGCAACPPCKYMAAQVTLIQLLRPSACRDRELMQLIIILSSLSIHLWK